MEKERQKQEHRDRPIAGADLHDRPGVPMERAPQALTPTTPQQVERQQPRRGLSRRAGLRQMTPVFGTAQPLSGVSGLVRRLGYSIRETRARHWMTLLLADRIDVLEHRVAKLVKLAAIIPAGVAGVVLTLRFLRD
jgi:hypothetical protein